MAIPKVLDSVQQLRAVAALGVLIFHIETQAARMGYEGYWPNFLSSGVDIFFVISGFIMWVTTYGRSTTPLQFLGNRLARIVPLYWLVTTFALVILLVQPSWMQSGVLSWPHVISSYLFFPIVHPVKLASMEPLIFAGWTLNYEMLFYAIFAIALMLSTKARLWFTILVLAALAALRLTNPEPLTVLWFYSHDIILEFGFGVLIGWYITAERSVLPWLSYVLIGVGSVTLALFAANPDIDALRVLVRGAPSALIVLGAVSLEVEGRKIRSAFVNYLGDASYSIYLVHGIALSAYTQIWRIVLPQGTEQNLMAFTVSAVVACCLASIVVYEVVEKPITLAIKKWRDSRKIQSAPQTAP